ncbi:hypothetical protein [Catellatospora sp. NPDC049609]|uniref:fascin domain-containing protein n=1 Tax=Catellatospora sp. NPDC049609 TaxID=3155505 RepID=UPI0034224F97
MAFRRFKAAVAAASVGLCAGLVAAVAGAAPAHAANCMDGALYSLGAKKYVTAELGYTGTGYGMLRARATSVGDWERFEFCYESGTSGGMLSIRSLANNRWVTVETGYTGVDNGMLRASSTSVGTKQYFWAWNGGLNSDANGKYATAELSYTGARLGMLRSRATTAGPWEKYEIR